MADQSFIDQLAEAQHNIWARWMAYMFGQCGELHEDHTFVIHPHHVERWLEWTAAEYHELSKDRKDAQRKVVTEFLLPTLDVSDD